MTSPVRIAGFAALVFVIAACGGSSGETSADTTTKSALTTAKVIGGAPATATSVAARALEGTAILTASDNKFGPAKARPNDKVQLVSGDPVGHTVVSETKAWTFDDKTSSFMAPSKAGSYPFYCGVHGKSMSGVLTVTE